MTSIFLTERCLTAFGMTMIVGMEGINGGGWAATKNPLLLAKFAVISTEGRNLHATPISHIVLILKQMNLFLPQTVQMDTNMSGI